MGPYSPQEPAPEIALERATFIGDTLSVLAYGASLVLFLQCMYAFYNRGDMARERRWLFMLYISLMFSFGTAYIGINSTLWRNMFVDDRNYPGGPMGYSLGIYNQPPSVAANAFFVLANWFADGLLLYRCLVVYSERHWVVLFPGMMYLGSISMGIALQYATSRPSADAWTKGSVDFGLAYFSLSCSLNIILTILISGRILAHRRYMHSALGESHADTYVSIAALLIESSMLYAVFSLLFIAPYAASSNLSNIFLPVLSQIQIIAPLLIMLRVAGRHAWTSTTANMQNSSLSFATPGESRNRSDGDESSAIRVRMTHHSDSVSVLRSQAKKGASARSVPSLVSA
ncbi:hypothetical protein BV22DRAFT_1129896 [Leucogyrophana mollusca]|uniref:Uncharacterized protein n=1 Tax=Leucogyrophana mollusca TaxID=85980 RepID=A0ACB8BET7_9AGAM|nr:hypothetical protein BV22DRAFT_1129896 [Leucogyrophana mollusca]